MGRNMHFVKQTTKRRAQATLQVSFYDGDRHEPAPTTVRTEVRPLAGGGHLHSDSLSRGGHRAYSPDRAPGSRRILAIGWQPVRIPVAVSGAVLGCAVHHRLHGRTPGPHRVR